MKRWFVILGIIFFTAWGHAAVLEVKGFRVNEDDQTALTENRFDKQAQMCALLKIKSSVVGMSFTGNPAVTEQKFVEEVGAYYVYVSPKQTVLTIKTEEHRPLEYQTPVLLSGRVYEMDIISIDKNPEDEKGTIYIKSNPPAEIFLNETSQGYTPRFLTGLKVGKYKVRLHADGYRDYIHTDVVVEEDKTTDIIVDLISADGRMASGQTPEQATKKQKIKRPQDNGWFAGISLGAVFPNKYPANYYNGSAGNDNSVYRLFQDYGGESVYYQKVYQEIANAIGYNFYTGKDSIGTPQEMSYNIAANFGLYGGYIFKKKNRIVLSFDYHRLKAKDVLVLYHIMETEGNKDGYYTTGSIVGKEDRFNINLGYSREFDAGEFITWYLMAGVNLNNTVVRSNEIFIPQRNSRESLNYSIKYRPLNPDGTASSLDYEEGGTGYGGIAAIGARFKFTDKFSIDPEFQFSYTKIALNGYEKFKPSYQINVKINLFTTWGKRKQAVPEGE